MADATVAIDGPVRREAPVAQLHAAFSDLPPGEYRVSARSPGYEPDPAHPSQPVTVYPQGCPDTSVALRSTLELAGTVARHTGQSAGGVKLWLWEDKPRLAQPSATIYRGETAEDGTFRFSRVKPGRYHLLTAGPEAKSYFPGRPTRAEATPIEVNASQRLDNLQLVLRDPGARRTVRFRAVDTLGVPVAGAAVRDFNFDERSEQGGYASIGDAVRTGPDGSASVTLWENAHYRVDASAMKSFAEGAGSFHADVLPGQGGTEVTLVLKPWKVGGYRPGTK
ncbi:MAG: carboxypeptidase regulatory-like domain-containing protein [Bryobacterales bacterium]|nr:carboxypeptidase regulatory-like domain-containing protein [Bryobacterales bacterium]